MKRYEKPAVDILIFETSNLMAGSPSPGREGGTAGRPGLSKVHTFDDSTFEDEEE